MPQPRAEQLAEAQHVVAPLEQGRAAEMGKGVGKNLQLAIRLYCDAAAMGSPEGFSRIGRVLATAPGDMRNPGMANAYLAMAASLGSDTAMPKSKAIARHRSGWVRLMSPNSGSMSMPT